MVCRADQPKQLPPCTFEMPALVAVQHCPACCCGSPVTSFKVEIADFVGECGFEQSPGTVDESSKLFLRER